MSEKKLQIQAYERLLVAGIFAGLYAWAGMEHKWLRRFMAPILLQVYLLVRTRNWRYLPQLPFQIASLSLGYGADVLIWKILRRLIFAVANGIAFYPHYTWFKKKVPYLGILYISLLITLYIILGVFGLVTARFEELILGLSVVLLPIMAMPYERKNT